jgi:hypothetical protein
LLLVACGGGAGSSETEAEGQLRTTTSAFGDQTAVTEGTARQATTVLTSAGGERLVEITWKERTANYRIYRSTGVLEKNDVPVDRSLDAEQRNRIAAFAWKDGPKQQLPTGAGLKTQDMSGSAFCAVCRDEGSCYDCCVCGDGGLWYCLSWSVGCAFGF